MVLASTAISLSYQHTGKTKEKSSRPARSIINRTLDVKILDITGTRVHEKTAPCRFIDSVAPCTFMLYHVGFLFDRKFDVMFFEKTEV